MKKKKQKMKKKRKAYSWLPSIFCAAAGFLLYGIAAASEHSKDMVMGILERGGYGEEPVIHELLVDGPWEKAVELSVEVGSRQYSYEESRQVFDRILAELPGQILGENASLSEVQRDLTLPSEFPEYGVSVRWTSEDTEVMTSDGHISEGGSGSVWLSAELSDGVHKETGRFEIQVLPPSLTEIQKWKHDLTQEIKEAEEQSREEELFQLPKEYEGETLSYRKKSETDYRFLPILGIVAGGLLYARAAQERREEEKKRDRRLLLSYADLVYQLRVFLGAGLSLGMAWERIVMNYAVRKKEGRCNEEPVYEEMTAAYQRMQTGISEGQAIREFGIRCRLKPYRKLCSILEQNRKTGTKDLLYILEQEMADAWEQQKNLAKQIGEEAQTKLLLPLMLMLLVVMVIIMVPAMLSMG